MNAIAHIDLNLTVLYRSTDPFVNKKALAFSGHSSGGFVPLNVFYTRHPCFFARIPKFGAIA